MKVIIKTLFWGSIFFFFFITNQLFAQKKWSLQECINNAFENSYEIKQRMLEKESKNIQLQTTKTGIAPSLGTNVSQSFDFGWSQQADNLMINSSQTTTSFGVGLNMDLFKGLRTYHQITSNKLDLEAILFDIESAKESIELAVTAYYMQILVNKEMLEALKIQVQLSKEQAHRIEILVKNGKSSDSELYAAKSTLANDQLSVVEAQNTVRLSILDLAQLMNYPDVNNFDIENEIDSNFEAILNDNIDIDVIKNIALCSRPAMKAALSKIELAKRHIRITQSGWYPSLSLSASYGTGNFYRFNDIIVELPNGEKVILPNEPFGSQLKNNSRFSVGISLYVPIFDKLSTHFAVKQQKINVKFQELQLEETKRSLIKSIEQAFTNAVASKEKYFASQVAYTSSLVAFQYEEIKYNAGSSSNYEFNEAKNRYLRAQSNLIQAKFDYLFRVLILEYYGR
ncbi:MAG: TolC family protein [Bacteroidales bacterium]|jgi:outer membrane protein|nr:TolC family protein [Bacteroidales bacterium]